MIGVQLAGHPDARQRGIGHQRQAFPGEVVDHRQDAEPAAVGERVATGSRGYQRWFGPWGIVIGARVPSARLRPPRRRTCSRSSR